jgi:hypothetical protein
VSAIQYEGTLDTLLPITGLIISDGFKRLLQGFVGRFDDSKQTDQSSLSKVCWFDIGEDVGHNPSLPFPFMRCLPRRTMIEIKNVYPLYYKLVPLTEQYFAF